MKKVFAKILSLLLATLVLFSTFSFTIEKHYCMGQLANYSLVGKVKGCEMPMPSDTEKKSEESLDKTPCCKDIVEVVEGTNAELKIVKKLSFDTMQFATIFVTTYVNLFKEFSKNRIFFENHSPPLLTKDILVLYERYLI